LETDSKQNKGTNMNNDTIEPLVEADEFDARESKPEKIDPADLAQHAAMQAGFFDGPVPADIPAPPGLSTKRAELARFLEWRRRTQSEIEVLEEAHHRAIEALGGEASTKKKIDALIEADINEVLRFALDGQQITPKTLRAFERKQLEQKLKDDKHAAEVAAQTLAQIERQIDVKKIGLGFLDSRTERFVKSAVVEAARESDIGERYLQKISELREVWLQLIGLRSVVGTHDNFCHTAGYGLPGMEMTYFNLPALTSKDFQISANEQTLDKAAAPWRALATELVNNPNADAKIASAQH
jgi:hypothetical protein